MRLVTVAAGNIVEQTGYHAYGEATVKLLKTAKNNIGEKLVTPPMKGRRGCANKHQTTGKVYHVWVG